MVAMKVFPSPWGSHAKRTRRHTREVVETCQVDVIVVTLSESAREATDRDTSRRCGRICLNNNGDVTDIMTDDNTKHIGAWRPIDIDISGSSGLAKRTTLRDADERWMHF